MGWVLGGQRGSKQHRHRPKRTKISTYRQYSMQTWVFQIALFKGLFRIYPTYPYLRNTPWAQMRQQWHPRCTTETLGFRKRARSGGANWVQVTRQMSPSKAKGPRTAGSQRPACTHEDHQIPPQRPLLLQANFGIVKCTPQKLHSMSSWPHTVMLIWRKTSSMHHGTSTLERVDIRQLVSHCTMGCAEKSAKCSFCTTSKYHAQFCSSWPR